MPATEKTWYDLRILHLVFGIASIVMFVATIWLLAADHHREWKQYQRQFQDIEAWSLVSRAGEQQTANYENERRRLETLRDEAIVVAPDKKLVDGFVQQMGQFGERNERAETQITESYARLVETIEAAGADPDRDVAQLAAEVRPLKNDLLDRMQAVIAKVKFVEDKLAGDLKFRKADLAAWQSKYDLGVRDQIPAKELAEIKDGITRIRQGADENDTRSEQWLTSQYDVTKQQRQQLEAIYKEITFAEQLAEKNLKDHEASLSQLQRTLAEKTAFGRGALEMPIIDAFGRPLSIEQIWLPDLTLNNNFREVARFDRCITCHQGIAETAPGSAVEPGYPPEQPPQELSLATPDEPPASEIDDAGHEVGRTLQNVYGMELADVGPVNPNDVAVEFVWPNSAAAKSGLQRGDVITHVQVGQRMEKLVGGGQAYRYMIEQAPWGEPIRLVVRRGFPHPYSSHPRLDLFVGSLSPHRMMDLGCTICHEGQGSATEFKFASHTPNTPQQAAAWSEKYGWFDNHHWIFPMRPRRFIESSCLKCHHEVNELEPSQRFPDPPAPHLVHGYNLVKSYGCYGCHEIHGFDGPHRRIGPDLRNEPPYAPAAQQLAYLIDREAPVDADGDVAKKITAERRQMRKLAEQLSWHPEDNARRHDLVGLVDTDAQRAAALQKLLADGGLRGEARKLAQQIEQDTLDVDARQELVELLEEDRSSAAPELKGSSHDLAHLLAEPPVLSTTAHSTGDLLKDVEIPGTMRRVGPSLRYVGSKLGMGTLNKWIESPQSIRPTSKMPQFFGQHYHLQESPAALRTALDYEVVETRATAFYLASRSQAFEYMPADPRVTEDPNADRGREQFQVRGCLACHQHGETPQSKATHGPNLTNLGNKLRTERGKDWLRTWLLQPDRYHRRTSMPEMYLEPQLLMGEDGKPVPLAAGSDKFKMTDPAADIAAYLLGPDWQPVEDGLPTLDAEAETFQKSLKALALSYLTTVFAANQAEQYLVNGIPERLRATLKGAEVELVKSGNGDADLKGAQVELVESVSQEMLLAYVGRRTISKYGCAGCHDIPGLEGAKPIGTTMADWGRKETSKLAFEHITHFVEKKHAHDQHGNGKHSDASHEDDAQEAGAHDDDSANRRHEHLDPLTLDGDEGFFVGSLMHHQREGFLRQKLIEPRSYDYEKAENKGYNERLRMPLFPWGVNAAYEARRAGKSEAEIEAALEQAKHNDVQDVMTFVLGLVAEPPSSQYIYQPTPRREAIVQGHKVLQKFNCAGCHMLDLDRWKISYRPGDFEAPPAATLFPLLEPHFTPEQIYDSKNPDWRGLLHSELVGMLRTDNDGDPEVMAWLEEDEEFLTLKEYQEEFDGAPALLGYNVELWQPTMLDGHRFLVKDPLQTIPASMIRKHYPARGGDFAKLLLPIAVKLVRKTEPSATGPDAWAWVPPPLVRQGLKTQESWLTEFLLNPFPIRPGVLLRMPKFNMSRADAEKLTQYFAAKDHPNYPNQFVAQRTQEELDEANIRYQEQLQQLGLPPSTRMDDALNIVINKAGCIACHGVSDQMPEGSPRANGPNLARVYRRLQPEYMHRWIAKPSFVLPYTKMQVLIPYDPNSPTLGGFSLPVLDAEGKPVLDADGNPEIKQIYHGTSLEQLSAVVDLLANFDRYVESQTSIREKVEKEKQQEAAEPGPAGD